MQVLNRKLFRRYQAGYEVWDEDWLHPGNEVEDHDKAELVDAPLRMRMAYTPDGAYIGKPIWGHRLCTKRGIKPELRTAESNVCSIGFCDREQKWYGWSHRALYGFGVGSHVKPGDCAYTPTDKEDFRLDCIRFWDEEHHVGTSAVADEHGENGEMGVLISWRYDKSIPNEKLRDKINGVFQPYPDQYGRGEWTAETLADAKQMAIDFASGVA